MVNDKIDIIFEMAYIKELI